MSSTAIDMDDPFTPGFDIGYDYNTGYGLIQADKATEKLLKYIGIKPLSIFAECSENPGPSRNWRIHNPNPFNVNIEWELIFNPQSGSMVAESGDTYLSTVSDPYFNLMVISWNDQWGFLKKDAAFSPGYHCFGLKSSFADNNQVQSGHDLFVVTKTYPNPFKDKITLEIFTGDASDVSVNLYSIDGSLIKTEVFTDITGYSIVNINAHGIPQGMYVMKVMSGDGELIETIKLFKE